jgi:hypothetical protein
MLASPECREVSDAAVAVSRLAYRRLISAWKALFLGAPFRLWATDVVPLRGSPVLSACCSTVY